MQIERSALLDAVADGCGTAQALSMRTGAGTMCGGCLPLLYELTSEEAWQTVRCVEVIDRAARVKSFRFEIPPHHDVGPLQPAQRLVIQANIARHRSAALLHDHITGDGAAPLRNYGPTRA